MSVLDYYKKNSFNPVPIKFAIKSNIANFIEDGPIIRQTRNRAFEMVMTDPKLQFKEHEKIRTQFKENYRHMLEFVNIS